jgi:coenzyme PQQ biosynthesis protein PqqD
MSLYISDIPQRVGLPWQEIGENSLVLQPAQRFAHELNDLGTFVWKSIDGQRSVADIIDLVFEEFDADKSEIEQDVLVFIQQLHEKKLIA